ncbi:MAG TPA: sulfotransferase [Planctomycetota bacterium]|nr:sulfotransferase [Planctomycetota bacterium]
MTGAKVKVLFIAGSGRSGSTLLHNMLGQVEGFFGVGELYQIWGRGFSRNMLCGCRQTFRECGTWAEILERAYGGFDSVDVAAMHRLSNDFRMERLHRLLLPALRRKHLERLGPYLDGVERLYQAIAATSGARVIVDSSKTPFYGFLLNQIESLETYVVLLTRDPRATSHSWTRKKAFQPDGHAPFWMSRQHPAKSALQWSVRIGLTESYVRPDAAGYLRLRYESLVAHPRESLQRILDLLQEPAPLDFVNGSRVAIRAPNHSVFGNLVRFRSGDVELQPDENWRRDMHPAHKLAVTALTLPWLGKYGYSARPGGARPA